jgi:hypothetical protein
MSARRHEHDRSRKSWGGRKWESHRRSWGSRDDDCGDDRNDDCDDRDSCDDDW